MRNCRYSMSLYLFFVISVTGRKTLSYFSWTKPFCLDRFCTQRTDRKTNKQTNKQTHKQTNKQKVVSRWQSTSTKHKQAGERENKNKQTKKHQQNTAVRESTRESVRARVWESERLQASVCNYCPYNLSVSQSVPSSFLQNFGSL